MASAQVIIEERNAIQEKKILVTMNTCLKCGRTFNFKRGRKRCPCCQGLLISKVMIIKPLAQS